KGVGLDPLQLSPVQTRIALGSFKCRTGAVHPGDFVADSREMQCKPALIAKDIQSFALGVLCSYGIVFPLIKKSPRLLPAKRIEQKPHTVHLKFSCAKRRSIMRTRGDGCPHPSGRALLASRRGKRGWARGGTRSTPSLRSVAQGRLRPYVFIADPNDPALPLLKLFQAP